MEYYLVVSITFTLYLVIISYFYYGWVNEPIYKKKSESYIPLSIIVPFRNEDQNIPNIYKALKEQSLPPHLMEIIFINDHSTDASVKILNNLIAKEKNMTLLHSHDNGKKLALKKAVQQCKYQYFVTIDADCIPGKHWLTNISNFLQQQKSDLLVGSVSFFKKNTWFSKFQFYEFVSLIVSGAGAIIQHKPIMCNGANLTVSKDLYQKAQNTVLNKYASGDDIFLLQYAKKNNYKIDFIKTKESNVYTLSAQSLTEFFHQRIRWASKSKGYKDLFTIFVAIIVFAVCLIEITLPFFLMKNTTISLFIFSGILFKGIIDYKIIQSGSNFLGEKINLFDYLSFTIVYPVYIVSTTLLSFFTKTKWKDRRI